MTGVDRARVRADVRAVAYASGILGSTGFFSGLRTLQNHQKSVATSLERLATGKRINRAGDDPSGLQAAEQLKFRQRTIEKKLDAFEREEYRLGAREGGLGVIQDSLLELSGLVVQGANTGALGEGELDAIGVQVQGVLDGITHVVTNTFFGGEQILAGDTPDLGGLVEALAKDPESAQKIVDGAIDAVATKRAAIGARVNAIGHERNALLGEQESNAGALSSIEDTDYAKEASELVRSQILEQATIKAIQIDREQAGRVLDLITSVPAGNRPNGR